jgi:two-component system, chemotaxis family, CheB/CheR fusion protein
LQEFFRNVSGDLGAAYVVIVHLAPDRESDLPAILGRETAMPVVQVGDDAQVDLAPNHVYVIAPDRKLELTDAGIGASPFERPRGQRAAVDLFFRSLCHAHSDIYAVILSGSGSDGASGAAAVREAGGLVLVQDPDEAAFGGMPSAVIAAGVADVVLPVRELTRRLAALIGDHDRATHLAEASKRQGAKVSGGEQPAAAAPGGQEDVEQALQRVFDLLRRRTGQDFSKYKRSTILRRLGRRMQLHHAASIAEYLGHLEASADEAQALVSDFLITVTTFFRDPEAWAALHAHVVVPLVERANPAEPIRCWVAGCATGEEAYSLAMLFSEELQRRQIEQEFTIFASDVDERALAVAREGLYPQGIVADVPDERLRRWFRHTDDHYRVKAELRDCVVFAAHGLQRDPPFSRLHLISCRNLLIYLNPELQDQVMATFRYACREDGYLFLGSAETANPRWFRPLAKQHRIYAVQANAADRRSLLPDLTAATRQPLLRLPAERPRVDREDPMERHRVVLEELAPPSVLVDDRWNVQSYSESAGRFFEARGGPATLSVTESVRPELRGELTVSLRHALESREPWLSEFVTVACNAGPRRVAVLVQPRVQEGKAAGHALVSFLEAGPANPQQQALDQPSSEREHALQEKLHQAEQHIEHLHAEHYAAEEELRAANEELQSLNEEFRSTTEELETSKEELQSINEELQTVNLQLKLKLEETAGARDDLENLMAATGIATLFLDRQLRIKRFTPPLQSMFNVRMQDHGRAFGDITHVLDYQGLEEDARRLLQDLVPIERTVAARDGRTFIVQLTPYRATQDRIDGVVITLVDITRLKRAEDGLRRSERRLRALLEASADSLYVMSPDWTQMRAVQDTGSEADIAQPRPDWMDVYVLPDDQPRVRAAITEAIRTRNAFQLEHRVRRADDSVGWTLSRAAPVLDEHGAIVEWFGAASDVTERKAAEQALHEAARSKNEFLAVLSHELRNPLAPLRIGVELLRQAQDKPALLGTVRPMMERQLAHLVRLVDDLLDISRISQGRIELQRTGLDLNASIAAAIEQLGPDIAERRHELIVDLAQGPVKVYGDHERLTEVFANLLSNAAKYTHPGGTIRVRSEVKGQHVVVAIRDNGYGIPPDRVEGIFTLFSQVPEHREHTGGGGLGIGLALARKLVEMHEGSIAVTSEGLGHGSEFVVRLPLLRTAATAPAPDGPAAAPGRPRRVLVVEDNVDAAEGLRMLLELMGHVVRVVHDGASALQQVEAFRPEVALLDLGLPEMDGVELAGRLRALPGGDRLVLAAITGWGQDEDRQRTRAAGFDAHLVKPVGGKELEAVISG